MRTAADRPRFSRRDALRAAALGVIGLCALDLSAAALGADVAAFARARASESVRRAGELCRAAGVPKDGAGLLDGFSGASDADLARHLERRVREDFEADRVVTVSSWMLSSTEALLLALVR